MPNTKIVIDSYSQISKISEEELDDQIIDYLKNVKDRKLMSKQDKLALLTAARAWKESSFSDSAEIKDRTGIYYCVGILPFIDNQLERLASLSQKEGEFDEYLFSTSGFNSMNPLLTFKCLPNMPLFHISFNLDITGRYLMTYPNNDDFIQTCVRSIDDLEDGLIDAAIVGAACDQENILVKHHLHRVQNGLDFKAIDCSASLVLAKKIPKSGQYYIEKISSFYNPSAQYIYEDEYFLGSVDLASEIIKEISNNGHSLDEIIIRKYNHEIHIRRQS